MGCHHDVLLSLSIKITTSLENKILLFADLDIDSKYRWFLHIWKEGYYPQFVELHFVITNIIAVVRI